ncbi:LysR family transcriptional regulator [Pseudomonas boanensis]|uniref:LysR family transcriptional regulator n=1 Tax=Metapseudomonas boanensis TaxID=2822138 RepID=UPI0035D4C04F
MNNERKSLPSMKSLVVFESVFRLGSMTAAAQEHGTTQPVVSQRIRALEEDVGCALFDRSGGRLSPTGQGRFLYEEISSALSKINTSLDKLRDDSLDIAPSVSIAANFGFAHLWLLPRLGQLQQRFPRYRFDVTPADSDSCLEMLEADISIRFGEFVGSRPNEMLLAPELVFPVCSPEFAERNNLNGLIDALALDRAPVLHMDKNNPRWLDWTRWCLLAGLPQAQAGTGFKFNNYPLLLSSAIRGDGLALGWSCLVQDAISEGRLIALQPRVERSDHGYILTTRHRNSCTIQPVIDWLCQELSSASTG